MTNAILRTLAARLTGALMLAASVVAGASQGDARESAFVSDASSVAMGRIEPSYCASIDGIDYSLKQYFSSADDVSAATGLVVKGRTKEGVCCTAAKELAGGVCVDPVPTVESCAAQGLVLVAGKCVVYVPDPCPTSEDWFSGKFINYGEIGNGNWWDYAQQIHMGVRTEGSGRSRQHIFERAPYSSNNYLTWESTFNFNVTNPSEVGEFALTSTGVDDHMLIEVNGHAIAAVPGVYWMSSPAPWGFPRGEKGLRFFNGGATLHSGYGGAVMLLRKGEQDDFYGVNPYLDQLTYPFIGVPTYGRYFKGPDRGLNWGGYLTEETWGGVISYRMFPSLDTFGGIWEGHYIDIRPYLAAGNNKLRIIRASYGKTYGRIVINASAKSGASCN